MRIPLATNSRNPNSQNSLNIRENVFYNKKIKSMDTPNWVIQWPNDFTKGPQRIFSTSLLEPLPILA